MLTVSRDRSSVSELTAVFIHQVARSRSRSDACRSLTASVELKAVRVYMHGWEWYCRQMSRMINMVTSMSDGHNEVQVGFAAVTTSIANYMIASDPAMVGMHSLDAVHKVTAYLGTIIGAVTLTGSAVAFGKLHGVMPSKPLNLPGTRLPLLFLLPAFLLGDMPLLGALL